ncbi:serine/threonine protein kinase [Austwickia chelonae]|uniref:non-specific serine/threonine protein kinase n=1 Tax=Austwickia chelonae NBRC 105200 TaxID=1184607 RepID=K6ULX3_9MICO|nr:Stk1 family PASTA domain-containing Ser/Thr kinase [Austwickia chelonae]GAB77621.1 serine/threonine protein kinase PkaF [Austwickia chelonae NBRC 105200]SEW14299.1 serine/threonine protein kinase [Austwickia chelonae]
MTSALLVDTLIDDRYLVLRHLADGGMASVYLALDKRLDRQVALKVMRPDLVRDSVFVERFRREARAVAQLSHPNVVGVFDQGQDGEQVFLTMEFVKGRTLRSALDTDGAMTPRESLRVLRQVLAALASAHLAGIVHRDVKPENVLISDSGDVKVADFGLARTVNSVTAGTTGSTILGTVSYLAPEQVEHGIADPRSDVYAAGLVLYEMLTGVKAVDGDSPIQVAYQHVHGEVPRPSALRPGLSPVLDQLVAMATRREPHERPFDAEIFLEEMTAAERGLAPDELDLPPLGVPGASSGVAHTARVHRPTQPVPVMNPNGNEAATRRGRRTGPVPTNVLRRDMTGARGSWSSRLGPLRAFSPRQLAVFAATVVLFLSGLVGWYLLAGPGSQRTVPELSGMSQEQAIAALEAVDLRAEIIPIYSEDVRSGLVVSIEPVRGSVVRRSTAVAVSISKGKDRVTIPEIVNQPLDEAKKSIADARLSLGKVAEEFNESVKTGHVVSADPTSGTSVKPSTAVNLVVSKGRKPIEVKDWTGKSFAEAKSALERDGLVAQVSGEEFHNDIPQGAVIKQTPANGTLFKGAQVSFTISKGSELVKIPKVRGSSESQAVEALRAVGLEVEVDRFAGGLFGMAHSTSPKAGSSVPRGTKVVLRVF